MCSFFCFWTLNSVSIRNALFLLSWSSCIDWLSIFSIISTRNSSTVSICSTFIWKKTDIEFWCLSSIIKNILKRSWNLSMIISAERLTTMNHELRISKFKINRLNHQFSWSQTIESKSYSTINSNYRISISRSSTI